MAEKSNGMSDWARALRKEGVRTPGGDKIARAFSRPREMGYEEVERVGLPMLPRYTASANEMLDNFDTFVPNDTHHKWFVGLDPKDVTSENERIRIQIAERDRIVKMVKEKLARAGVSASEYTMSVGETYEQVFGGTIVVKQDGSVYGEFVAGNPGVVSGGTAHKDQLYRVQKDQYFDSFRYSKSNDKVLSDTIEEDVRAKKAFWDAMNSIPHTGKGRDLKFHQGYYEFVVVDKRGDGKLKPYFIDYHDEELLT